jgi:hypothetical protein
MITEREPATAPQPAAGPGVTIITTRADPEPHQPLVVRQPKTGNCATRGSSERSAGLRPGRRATSNGRGSAGQWGRPPGGRPADSSPRPRRRSRPGPAAPATVPKAPGTCPRSGTGHRTTHGSTSRNNDQHLWWQRGPALRGGYGIMTTRQGPGTAPYTASRPEIAINVGGGHAGQCAGAERDHDHRTGADNRAIRGSGPPNDDHRSRRRAFGPPPGRNSGRDSDPRGARRATPRVAGSRARRATSVGGRSEVASVS